MILKQIVINDHLVSYYVANQNKNAQKALVFLHGWRSDARAWFGVINSLTDADYQIFALDLPGFGKSDKPKTDFELQDYVEVVSQFIKKLELNNVILIGHSFGGRIAIKFSAGNLESIVKLVLVDSAGIGFKPKAQLIKKIIAKILKPLFSFRFMQSLRRKIYQAMGAEDYVAAPELKQTYLNIINEDLTVEVQKTKVPTLIIWGEQDKVTPLAQGKRIHSHIPHSTFHILKNAGHFSFLDKPEEFTEALDKFIKS